MNKVNGTKTVILKEYSQEYDSLTDDQAEDLIRRWLETDVEQAELRQQFAGIFRKVLPGKKAATFLQRERRISMMTGWADYIETCSCPERGLDFFLGRGHVRGRETNRADRFCVDDHE
jgi:hypothetical protein